MTGIQRYLPRCRTCGPLHAPCALAAAVDICAGHRINHPNHKTSWARLPGGRTKTEAAKQGEQND